VPEGGRVAVVARRVDDPRLYAGFVLRSALREAGVDVGGGVATGGEAERALLSAHRSAELGEVLAALGKDSDNFVAEMVLKSLGAKEKGRPATSEAGAEAVADTLRSLGAFDAGSVVRNGSGLFDANRTTAASLATLLRAAQREPALGPELVSHLSIGGVDGTLRGRFRSWAKTRAVRAKTGTLKSVVALSGYVLAPAGRSPVAFSLIVNGIPDKVGAVRPLLDAVVDALAHRLWAGDPREPSDPPDATAQR
jgi:D-alanyl-D-alanine carboxypeptidase/D-alanyl-D-alanine-endopeptidase (penicillin-binding protein 4)